MAELEQKNDDDAVTAKGEIRVPLARLRDPKTWAAIIVGVWIAQDIAVKATAFNAANEVQQTVNEVKEIAREETVPAIQQAASAAQKASHELHNGLAKRMAKELDAVQAPRFDAMQKQINELRQETSDLRRFLLGEGGAGTQQPNTETASRDAG